MVTIPKIFQIDSIVPAPCSEAVKCLIKWTNIRCLSFARMPGEASLFSILHFVLLLIFACDAFWPTNVCDGFLSKSVETKSDKEAKLNEFTDFADMEWLDSMAFSIWKLSVPSKRCGSWTNYRGIFLHLLRKWVVKRNEWWKLIGVVGISKEFGLAKRKQYDSLDFFRAIDFSWRRRSSRKQYLKKLLGELPSNSPQIKSNYSNLSIFNTKYLFGRRIFHKIKNKKTKKRNFPNIRVKRHRESPARRFNHFL